MKKIPTNFERYKSTPVFDETSIPAGLLKAHKTKEGAWGKIVIFSGQLNYRILEPEVEDHLLTPEYHGVVEPTVLHDVSPNGQVTFQVDFYRNPDR